MDIAAWLRSLGLERYEPAFRDNEIDADVLPKLTADDLKDLGVTLVGHRRKLLEAIAALSAEALPTGEPAAPPAESPQGERTDTAARGAERRQLTVMFVDLVGSTELSGRLDPEDLREVIRRYQDACAGVIARFEGHIAKYMGDGVLAYFGYPQAYEDAAERAVRAGLGVVEAVGRLVAPDDGTPLAARAGIATGLVVVGELTGEGAAQEQAVVGETLNLAARLQNLGEPGSVVISRRTRQLVGDLFDLADLGGYQVKGFPRPVRAWRVVGEGAAESRFEALHTAGLTPLVGREHELGLLLERWQQAKDGEGQVVLLSGEPGIGKSRLTRALRERLEDEPHTPLSHYCSPYHRTSALHPVIGLLERAAGFARDDPPEGKLDKLEALLARAVEDPRAVAPLLADLLAIPAGERYPPLDLTPQRQKDKTLAALIDQLAGLAAQQPVLVVYEDVHWSDPTTLELLDLAIDRVETLPVLMLITFRPEFSPPWGGGHAHVTALSLNRLGRRQGGAMVERVTGGKALPAEVLEQIVAKTDGVPLFVEELTKTVLESGLLREEGDRYALAGPLPPLAIPETLQDSLMARLDRLAPVKEVAQIGAAIGREFSHELLAAVAPLGDNELRDALGRLAEAGLVFRRGTPPEATYSFKHALVRDAAYGTLLRSKRQQLHARIAQTLEARFPETAETEPELLAHHCTEAGLTAEAVAYWYRAGQRALAHSATTEAVTQLTRGLELLGGLSEGAERDRRELDLQAALGGALLAAKGWAAAETGRAYARARELAERLGATRHLFPALWGLTVFHVNRGEPDAGRAVAEEMLRLAERQEDVAVRIASHRALAAALYHLGAWVPARAHLERVLTLYEALPRRPPPSLYTVDHRVMALSFLPTTLFALGYPEQARARSREGLADARELGHPHSLALALDFACEFLCAACDWEAAHLQAQALTAVSAEQRFSHYLAAGKLLCGCARATLDRTPESVALLHEAFSAHRAGGHRVNPLYPGVLAEAHRKAGRPDEALRLLAEVLEQVTSTGERWYEAELHRLRGEALLSLAARDPAEAEAGFLRAIEVARAQDARLWELRAATSLARLWRDQGRQAEARDLLVPVYAWFTEGFDSPDLTDARTLLGELGRPPASSAA